MGNNSEILLYQELGRAIKRFRSIQKMKQEELARVVGLSRASIVNIEKGRHHPQLHVLYSLASALKCHVFDLLPILDNAADQLPSKVNSQLHTHEKSAVAQLLNKAKR